MPVGNDVVDLRDAAARPVHPRFDLRVFAETERARLARVGAGAMEGAEQLAGRLRWSLWAAKEAAFKAARQLDPGLPFHPRRFVVEMLEEGRGRVVHELAGRFELWVEEARDWVHAVATPEDEAAEPRRALAFLEEWEAWGARPGERVRELARRAVGPLLAFDPSELRVVKDRSIPRLMRGDVQLPVTLSLSHHGRLVACAWSGGGGE